MILQLATAGYAALGCIDRRWGAVIVATVVFLSFLDVTGRFTVVATILALASRRWVPASFASIEIMIRLALKVVPLRWLRDPLDIDALGGLDVDLGQGAEPLGLKASLVAVTAWL